MGARGRALTMVFSRLRAAWQSPAYANSNVRASFSFTVLYALSSGIWGNSVLSGYLIEIPPKNNVQVGIAEGLQGTVQLLAALPAGWWADKHGRSRMLRLSAAVGLAAIVCFYVALGAGAALDHSPTNNGHLEFALLCIALSVYGLFDGMSSGAQDAIFHDSVSSEHRVQLTTTTYVVRVMTRAVGPVLSALLFYCIGDTWTRPEMRTVFLVGISLTLLPLWALFGFSEDACLPHQDNQGLVESPVGGRGRGAGAVGGGCGGGGARVGGGDYEQASAAGAPLASAAAIAPASEPAWAREPALHEPLLQQQIMLADGGEGADAGVSSAAADGEDDREARRARTRRALYWVPRIVLTSDVIFGIASGTTIKFFPLFFKQETGLSPAQVNLIFVFSPLLIAIFSSLAARAVEYLGRVWVPILCGVSGIVLLLWMWWMGQVNGGAQWREPALVVPVFLVRTALMNCSFPIRKSILNDFVGRDRAWWNSLDSVTRFSWSGSAVIGGLISDKHGYGATFLVTAAMQLVGLAAMAALLPWSDLISKASAAKK